MGRHVRIRQTEMDKIARFIDKAGIQKARVIVDLANSRIEIIVGDEPANATNPWDEHDAA